jgi:DnaJ-class molecular chaperone
MGKDLVYGTKRSESRTCLDELMVRCKKCKGDKVVKDKKRVEFQIEPGTENGERIALKGEGDEIVRPTQLLHN